MEMDWSLAVRRQAWICEAPSLHLQLLAIEPGFEAESFGFVLNRPKCEQAVLLVLRLPF